MIIPRTLVVNHWAQFERATLSLDVPGISFFRGRNDDANGNPNGAGKSSLFNALYTLQYGDHQLAVRKKSLKSVVNDNTRIIAKYDVDDEHTIKADMKNTTLKVSVDGNQIESRKKGDEREEFLANLGISAELHATTCQINGIASNPLIRGTSAMRCQFLERAFELDRWADLHAKVGDIISQMKRADTELEEVKQQLKDLGEDLDSQQIVADIEKHEAKRTKLRKMIKAATTALARAENLPEKPKEAVAELTKRITRLENDLDSASSAASDYVEWRNAAMKRKQLKEELEAIQLSKLGMPSEAGLNAKLDKISAAFAEFEYEQEHFKTLMIWKVRATKIAKDHEIKWSNIHQLRLLATSWLDNLREGVNNCPVCGSKLKRAVDGEALNQLRALHSKLPERIFDPVNEPQCAYTQQEYKTTEKLLDMVVKDKEDRATKRNLRRELAQLKVPPKPDSNPGNAKQLAEQLAIVREKLSAAKKWTEADDVDVGTTKRRLEKMETLLDTTDATLSKLYAQREKASEQSNSKKALEEKHTRLTKELELRPIYKALQLSYSPNGMRLWLLQELLEAIIGGLNEGAHSTRDRQMYGYKLSRNRELIITASNQKGTYDIRLLSGAESSMFVLNFLCVILPLLPSNRRSSLLILDEVDANCSTHSRGIIASEYIPRLLQVVPSIYWVTPTQPDEFSYEGAHENLIVKKNGVSRLIQ